MTPPTTTVRPAHASERQASRPSASRSNGPGSAASSRNASPKYTSRSAAPRGPGEGECRQQRKQQASCGPPAKRLPPRRPGRERRERVLAADDDRVEAEVAKRPQEHGRAAARAEARARRTSRRCEPRRCDRPRRRIGERDDDAAHVREALLPGRILDDDRHDVPAERAQPRPLGRRAPASDSRRGRRRSCPAGGRDRVGSSAWSPSSSARGGAENGASSRRARMSATRRRPRAAARRRVRREPRGRDRPPPRARRRHWLRSPRPRRPLPPACRARATPARTGRATAADRRESLRAGACCARYSRTTNSSLPRAAESRAEAAQSIHATWSPGRYGREPTTSSPWPRRTLRRLPNETPTNRRRGTSGKVRAAATNASRSGPRPSPVAASERGRGRPPR